MSPTCSWAVYTCAVSNVVGETDERVVRVSRTDANLGEIIALEWRDIDLAARRLTVERSDWQRHVTVSKGGRSRLNWEFPSW